MAGTLATAYVQIVPSARGIGDGLEDIFNDSDSEDSAEEKGESLGGKLMKGLAAVAGSAVVAKFFKDTFAAGAALQQSFGGLETLYGDAADAAKQYAMEATSAGISANTYAEQAVSFGAALKSAFGGDTVAAAEAANTAIMDMADNSAKMGTDIGSIQAAYQGFAKQNYTMLDNLKLGYGGTRSEMLRLLADAEALTGVHYDIENLGDVYSAIHAIQEDLGLTGVAAEEAKTTFSGSFGAMSAAAENFLATLFSGGDVSGAMSTLLSSTLTFLVGNFIPAVINILSGLPGAVIAAANELLPEDLGGFIDGLIGQLSTFLADGLPDMVEQGDTLLSGFLQGWWQGLPGLISGGGEAITNLLDGLLTGLPQMLRSGTTLVLNLVQGLIQAAPGVISAALTLVLNLLTTLLSHAPELLSTGLTMIGELIAGLIESIPDVISAAVDIFTSLLDSAKEIDWLQLGKDIIDGIIAGLTSAATALYNAVKNVIRTALSSGQEEAKTGSPSRLFRDELGRWMGLGIAEGVEEQTDDVNRSVRGLVTGSLTDGQKAIDWDASGMSSGASGAGVPAVQVVQHIYAQAQTASDLMIEARYQAEMAVMLGV